MVQPRIAIIGSGPTGLMAATLLAKAGTPVIVYEKSPGPARKLLIAGSSGLNVTTGAATASLPSMYTGDLNWQKLLGDFSPQDWLDFIHKFGFETYLGTSNRYFLRDKKASRFARTWIDSLKTQGVEFQYNTDCTKILKTEVGTWRLGAENIFDAIVFAVGGGSWLKAPATWPQIFQSYGIAVNAFTAANVGFEVAWKKEFITEVGRQPIKNIELTSALGSRRGDILITEYGIEGTPVYTVGTPGACFIDLKPDLTVMEIQNRLSRGGENLSPLRRAKRALRLSTVAHALLYHHGNSSSIADTIKKFPLHLLRPRPLTEAISSRGGIALTEINPHFMLHKMQGVFVAGEMLDWHAPTGGFLIQACVAQGAAAAAGVMAYLKK